MNPINTARLSRPSGELRPEAANAPKLPGHPSLPGDIDIASVLYQAQSISRTIQTRSALTSAASAQKNRDRALEDAQAALKRADDQMKDAEAKGKWINGLRLAGTIAAVVVAAASVVFSAGCSAPAAVALVGVVLSATSPYVAEYTGSEELGLALAVTGAALSLGAGIWSIATAGTSTALSATQRAAIEGGKMAAASAEVAAGATTIARGDDEADAMEHRADAQQQRANAAREQLIVDEAIEAIRVIEASTRRAIASIGRIAEEVSRTDGNVIQNLRRA